MAKTLLTILLCSILVISYSNGKLKKYAYPPHCTQVTKVTDYFSRFKFDYPVSYILPGQHEAYQKLFCIHPPSVNKAVTTVCDWVAAPLVQFTLGDEYLHVVRQDPTGHYAGNAVITTQQFCNHNLTSLDFDALEVIVNEVN